MTPTIAPTMAQIWVPLLVALILALAGFVGIVWTQRAADRRATQDRVDARQREQDRTTVEATQRQLDWERGRRLEAHTTFLAEQWKAERYITEYNQPGNREFDPHPDWTEPMARAFDVLRIFGSQDSVSAAKTVLHLTIKILTEMWAGPSDIDRFRKLDAARDRYVAAVQRDLGMQETSPPDHYGQDVLDGDVQGGGPG